jgi:hypothetical protein
MVEIRDTSFGEASSRTQATDPNRRETLRIRTPLPGLRGEAKWLAAVRPRKREPALAIRRGVPKLLRERLPGILPILVFVSSGVTL